MLKQENTNASGRYKLKFINANVNTEGQTYVPVTHDTHLAMTSQGHDITIVLLVVVSMFQH